MSARESITIPRIILKLFPAQSGPRFRYNCFSFVFFIPRLCLHPSNDEAPLLLTTFGDDYCFRFLSPPGPTVPVITLQRKSTFINGIRGRLLDFSFYLPPPGVLCFLYLNDQVHSLMPFGGDDRSLIKPLHTLSFALLTLIDLPHRMPLFPLFRPYLRIPDGIMICLEDPT